MEKRVALHHLQAHKLLIIKMKSWKEEWFEGVEKVRVLKLVGYLKLKATASAMDKNGHQDKGIREGSKKLFKFFSIESGLMNLFQISD